MQFLKGVSYLNILVVEDETRLADALGHILEGAGYIVDVVYDGEDAFSYGMNSLYDAILLDVMLPKRNGFDVAKDLRRNGINTPIIMLTARSTKEDIIQGLDNGADDYITKPFEPEELLARVRAVTRRQGEVVLNELSFGDIELDLSSRELSCGIKSVNLSQKEFDVLSLLMTNSGQTVTKDMLIAKIWGVESDAVDNNVEAYISFLRKKLSYLNSSVTISTIRKLGYRLMDDRQVPNL